MCKRRLGEDLIKIYIAQLVNFLEYMQQHGVMHRDLKPQNIMLDKEFNIKVIDFGDSKRQNVIQKKAQKGDDDYNSDDDNGDDLNL